MPTKNRTSKCREWERERRNKFNNACNQLALLVVEITDKNEIAHGHSAQNASPHLAKIEVVLRAISCIKNLLEIKVKLEEKVIALEASVNVFKNISKKDASVQVQIVTKVTKSKNIESKKISRKEKCIIPVKVDKTEKKIKLPKLLPKTTENNAPDKAVIMLSAASYVMPHRPVILSADQPTLVLLQNLTPSSRSALPIMSRVVSEITKTTMVNNIPISAFSFPLSGENFKKSVSNSKKKLGRKQTNKVKILKTNKNFSKSVTKKGIISKENHNVETAVRDQISKENKSPENPSEINTIKENITSLITESALNGDKLKVKAQEVTLKENAKNEKECTVSKENDITKNEEVNIKIDAIREMQDVQKNLETNDIPESNKDSQDKLGSILDTSICDNTVDGGNARLELAEELLAASPTAAFLMSFPLVSGVRADSPAEDEHAATNARPLSQIKRDSAAIDTHSIESFFAKSENIEKIQRNENFNTESSRIFHNKLRLSDKQSISKDTIQSEIVVSPIKSQTVNENSFLHLHSSVLNSTVNASENSMIPFDFDQSYSKAASAMSQTHSSNSILRNDSSTTKSNSLSMYASNALPVAHDYNNFGLYPCAMEKYSHNIKGKSDNYTADDSGHKIGCGRLSYDFDLNLTQKPFEFSNIANNGSNICKDNIFSSVATTFSNSSYNPFNPDSHVPLTTTTSQSTSIKKTNIKTNPFYTDTFTNLYSQPSTLWPEDLNFYTNNNANTPKSNMKSQMHSSFNEQQPNKLYPGNIFQNKVQNYSNCLAKPSKLEVNQLVSDKNNKKPPSKTHINWMTSEARPTFGSTFMHQTECKDSNRIQLDNSVNMALLPHYEYNSVHKKQDYVEPNLFSLSIPTHHNQEDIQLWPPAKPLMSVEVSLDPPPINLPTLVGDLALGPHERRKSVERHHRGNPAPSEMSGCNTFFSVTQLMNRPAEPPAPGRGQTATRDLQKQSSLNINHMVNYPSVAGHEKNQYQGGTNSTQPCYFISEPKQTNVHYGNSQVKPKSHKASEKLKYQKNNYSTEALLKGVTNDKVDNFSVKFSNTTAHKYPSYVPGQDVQVTQVSHFPCISDYPENAYSGTGFYNSSCTVSNSFYSNLMSTNYTQANFTPEYVDYSAAADCNFAYPIFDNLKMGNQTDVLLKSLDSTAAPKESVKKHKIEFSKKEQTKKYPNKKAKMSESKDWNESEVHLATKIPKKSSYITSEDYVASYLVNQGLPLSPHTVLPELVTYPAPTPTPIVTPSTSKTPLNCPTSATRTNFNLSTLFPEIAKVRQN